MLVEGQVRKRKDKNANKGRSCRKWAAREPGAPPVVASRAPVVDDDDDDYEDVSTDEETVDGGAVGASAAAAGVKSNGSGGGEVPAAAAAGGRGGKSGRAAAAGGGGEGCPVSGLWSALAGVALVAVVAIFCSLVWLTLTRVADRPASLVPNADSSVNANPAVQLEGSESDPLEGIAPAMPAPPHAAAAGGGGGGAAGGEAAGLQRRVRVKQIVKVHTHPDGSVTEEVVSEEIIENASEEELDSGTVVEDADPEVVKQIEEKKQKQQPQQSSAPQIEATPAVPRDDTMSLTSLAANAEEAGGKAGGADSMDEKFIDDLIETDCASVHCSNKSLAAAVVVVVFGTLFATVH